MGTEEDLRRFAEKIGALGASIDALKEQQRADSDRADRAHGKIATKIDGVTEQVGVIGDRLIVAEQNVGEVTRRLDEEIDPAVGRFVESEQQGIGMRRALLGLWTAIGFIVATAVALWTGLI